MPLATLTSKGQITIPSSVRKKLHLHTGDKIDFSLVGEHEVLMRPVVKSVDTVFGCLKQASNGITASVDEMDEALAKGCGNIHERTGYQCVDSISGG